MKYIDADKLIVGIEHLYPDSTNEHIVEGFSYGLDKVKSLITSLQQEQLDYKEAVQLVFEEKLTPYKDGNQWCFLLGRNIQDGICGFGDTILDAAVAFYKDYTNTRIHIGELKISMVQQEQPECIYGRTLEERKKYCKFCSAICKARIEQEQPKVDLENYISNKLRELGADLINHKPYSFNRGLNVGETNAYHDILDRLNARKEG